MPEKFEKKETGDVKPQTDVAKKKEGPGEIGKTAIRGHKESKSPDDAKYARPSDYRSGVRPEVWEKAKDSKGKVHDPVTGKEIKPSQDWDMGHKPGYEFRKHQKSAAERGISREQFLDEHNIPRHYRPELPTSNRSHKGESKSDAYAGP